ncbi:hypothetical protein MMC17_006858 [Xylographa soralifera]|nr:hypothetical protein [Xylographa soralifera]MCJ1383744.1 hypothetical protein [Xylographa soralifera]
MEQRAAIPPGLPRSSPTVSYWQDPPSSLAMHRTTPLLPTSVSFLVIGSGITGSSIAYNLLSQQSTASVLLLEARTACSGATGRNGGHTKCASYRSFLDNVDALGEVEAAKIVRYEYACMKAVHALAREHGIECDSWEGDTVDIIYDEDQWKVAKLAVQEIRKVLGVSDPASVYHFWDANEAETKFLSPGAFGAVSYEAGSLSPYKFVIGVLHLALEKGLNLQTDTPALSMRASEKGWVVDTSRGAVNAKKVILATNGYTAHLHPALQGLIVPLRGHMTAQRPGSRMPCAGLATTYSFIYADGYEYMIPRPQGSTFAGDIMIGGGLTKASQNGLNEFGTTDDTTQDPIIVSYLEKSTPKYFGFNWGDDHPAGRVRKAWTGIMGYSADGFPFVGPVPDEDNLFIAASFQGHGMVLCLLAAKALVQTIAREDLAKMDRWFPKAFVITKERMKHKFQGRLHTTAPKDLEITSQRQCT